MFYLMPKTPDDFYRALASITLTYTAISYVCVGLKTRTLPDIKECALSVLDGGALSSSIMLLIGIFDDDVMKLVGDTKLPLLFAGVLGLIFPLHNLVSRLRSGKSG